MLNMQNNNNVFPYNNNVFPYNYHVMKPYVIFMRIFIFMILILDNYYAGYSVDNILAIAFGYVHSMVSCKILWVLFYGPRYDYFYKCNLHIEYLGFCLYAVAHLGFTFGMIFVYSKQSFFKLLNYTIYLLIKLKMNLI